MPTLADMEAATPKCPTVKVFQKPSAHLRCGRPMSYDAEKNRWRCPIHPQGIDGEDLAAATSGYVAFADAA